MSLPGLDPLTARFEALLDHIRAMSPEEREAFVERYNSATQEERKQAQLDAVAKK